MRPIEQSDNSEFCERTTTAEPTIGQVAAVCGFLLVAVVLVFGQTVGYGFVNYDDEKYVTGNPNLADGLGVESIRWAFTTDRCSNWHPLTWLSYLLDYQICGFTPWGYHLSNVLLHAAAAVALFWVLWRISGNVWPGAFVAAVFAVHPLRAESVAWIAERKDVLSGLLFLLTLAAYAGYARRPFSWARYLSVVGLFALGLMAKPMLVTLPLVMLLLDYWPLNRYRWGSSCTANPGATVQLSPQQTRPPRRMTLSWRLVIEKLPLLALSAGSCVMTFWAQAEVIKQMGRVPMPSRIANAAVSYATYVVQLFYPVKLAVLYPLSVDGPMPRQVAGALALLAVITAAAVILWRRYPWLLVGWLWYLGMLVPVIGLVQVGEQSMANRYTYLPQIGLLIALAWGAHGAMRSWPNRAWLYGISSALALAMLMGCAWRQTSYWSDSETLWKHTIACTERNVAAHNNLGAALAQQGRLEEAIAQFNKALEIDPRYERACNNLGLALASRGRVDEALAQYQKALELKPDYAEAHNNMGLALVGRGDIDEAIVHFRRAVEIDPDYAAARRNLDVALGEKGRKE